MPLTTALLGHGLWVSRWQHTSWAAGQCVVSMGMAEAVAKLQRSIPVKLLYCHAEAQCKRVGRRTAV